MKLVVLLLSFAALGQTQGFDLLIRGGRIVDGTGNPSYLGDVGIRQGKIVAMGHLAGGTATRTLEASRLTVAPGFIDIHNHSDYAVVEDPEAESMVRQGVTSMILGEGDSAAPVGGSKIGRAKIRIGPTSKATSRVFGARGFQPTSAATWVQARSGRTCAGPRPVRPRQQS